MGFLESLADLVQDFFQSLFSSSSPEYKKKKQLKQLTNTIKSVDPPIWRPDGTLLPSFPLTLYQACQFLQPVRETLASTIASPDKRTAERYRDYLIELVLTDEQRELRKSFTLTERSIALLASTGTPEYAIEEQGKQFSQYLKLLDSSSMRQAGVLLQKLDDFTGFCLFDFNSFLAFFDPAFSAHAGKDTTVEVPSFKTVEVAEVVPSLLDLYYTLVKLDLGPGIIDVVSLLDARRRNLPLGEDTQNRIAHIFQAVSYLFQKRLNKNILLSIIRITKEEPDFVPELPTMKTDYIQLYRTRITEFFHSDSRRLLKEHQDTEIQQLIDGTFGNLKIDTLSGYSENTNALLQEFTPFSLEWIKPLEIIKTFTNRYFDPHFRQILSSLIVEGYFNNRSMQSSIASSYYYCEAMKEKMAEFEQLFDENQPCSIKILTGYLTELEKGMDFEKPLRKMVENMNAHAKAFVQQSVSQYAEIFNFSSMVLEDYKKTVPEYITNIRTLAITAKNTESFVLLEKEIGVFRNFLEIMKKYAIVGTLSVSASLAEQTES
jgi:hypothetical protein